MAQSQEYFERIYRDTTTGNHEVPSISNGAGHVMDGFKPSSYDADLTMDGTAQSVALASGVALGAGRVRVANLGATTEAIRVAFGTSAANAEANLTHSSDHATTGIYIPAAAEGGSQSVIILGVPALATHIAVENAVASDTQAVNITQGV